MLRWQLRCFCALDRPCTHQGTPGIDKGSRLTPRPSPFHHRNLRAERLEIRTASDPQVAPFVHGKDVRVLRVAADPTLTRVLGQLGEALASVVKKANRHGLQLPVRDDLAPAAFQSAEADLGTALQGPQRTRVLHVLRQGRVLATTRELLASYGARNAWNYLGPKLYAPSGAARGVGADAAAAYAMRTIHEAYPDFPAVKEALRKASESQAENPKVRGRVGVGGAMRSCVGCAVLGQVGMTTVRVEESSRPINITPILTLPSPAAPRVAGPAA